MGAREESSGQVGLSLLRFLSNPRGAERGLREGEKVRHAMTSTYQNMDRRPASLGNRADWKLSSASV